MTTQTVQLAGVAALPRVNLLPPEIAEAAHFRRVQLAMGVGVLAAVVIMGALHFHAKSGISSAQDSLTAAQSSNTALQTKLNGLSSVSTTYDTVQNERTMLATAMGTEIDWSYMLTDLSLRMPSNVWLTAIQATETGATVATPGVATTTLPGQIGTISFSATGYKHNDVATWLVALSKERGFEDPTFTSSTEAAIGTKHVVNFGSSAVLTANALSNRYIIKEAGN